MNKGLIYVISAYIFWGLHPIYWKLLKSVPSTEIVSHRIFWSFVFFVAIMFFRQQWSGMIKKIKTEKKWIMITPAFLIGSNWAMYIWAVNANYIIETSLGYFICPLISVLLGVFLLHEKLRPAQWIAVGIACIGVLIMTFLYGQFPWISLYLAATWGLYGLLRKKSPLNSVEGLTLETAILSIPALVYLIFVMRSGHVAFLSTVPVSLLLIGAGVTSGLPLLVFVAGARLANLSVVGILQYIYPVLILSVGVFLYHEPFTQSKWVGFVFVWVALFVFILDSMMQMRRNGKKSE